MEKTRSVKEEMEGKLFISRQSRHIFFVIIMIKVLFPTLYLYLACKHYVSRQGNGINRRNESTRGGDSEYHFDYQLTVLIATSWFF